MKVRIEFELDEKDYKTYEHILNDFETQMTDLGYFIEIFETDN